MKRPSAAVAALLLASCGGPTLFAEIEIPELHVTLPSQQVPAFDAPDVSSWCDPAGIGNPPCVKLDTTYDLAAQVPALDKSGITTELRLTDLALTFVQSTGGAISDFSHVQSVAVLVGSPAVVVASYTRTSTATPPTTISVSGKANLDLASYLAAGKLPFRVQVVVDGGTPAFTADITAGFYVRVKMDYLKLL